MESVTIVVPRYLHIGVVSSQIMSLINYVKSPNVFLIVPESLKPHYYLILNKTKRPICIEFYKSLRQLYSLIKSKENLYIRHYESFIVASIAQITSGFSKTVIYDFRSLLYIESWYRNRSMIRVVSLWLLEFLAYRCSSKVCCVSESLKVRLVRDFGRREVLVFACGVEDVKLRMWKEITSLKFVYCGSLENWQCFDKILASYKAITCQSEWKVSLSVFTNEVELAKIIANSIGVELAEVNQLSQDQVLERLTEFDFGFLYRENISVNNVASPIKFLEYISRGVIPIVSSGIGDFSKDAEKYELGCIVDEWKLDIKKLVAIRSDKNLYARLHRYSGAFTWVQMMRRHPLNTV